MYELYYSPGACSMAVHVLLNELNVPFELKNTSIPDGKNKDPGFLKLNPLGQIPVLVDDGKVLREGAAIITYLCDKHPGPLFPRSGWERAQAQQWLAFGNATLHPAYGRAMWLRKNLKDGPEKQEALEKATDLIQARWDLAEQQLSQTPYLAGQTLTPADILMTVVANWVSMPSRPITFGPNVQRVLKEVSQRPAYQKALQAENVTYKAAA